MTGHTTKQGGGAEGTRKKSMRHKDGGAMNTMGMGKSKKQMGSSGSMGKHQQTGDGGASK